MSGRLPLPERAVSLLACPVCGAGLAAVAEGLRCAARFPDTDVLVFGHSHIPWDTTTPGGLRLLNPGSPTDRRRQPHGTYVTAVADGGRLRDVAFHAVPPRR